jgi:hypothetical protein
MQNPGNSLFDFALLPEAACRAEAKVQGVLKKVTLLPQLHSFVIFVQARHCYY